MAENDKAIFLNSILLARDKAGAWSITKVATNHGKFAIEDHPNQLVNLEITQQFCSHISQTLKPMLEELLEEEAVVLTTESQSDGPNSTTAGTASPTA